MECYCFLFSIKPFWCYTLTSQPFHIWQDIFFLKAMLMSKRLPPPNNPESPAPASASCGTKMAVTFPVLAYSALRWDVTGGMSDVVGGPLVVLDWKVVFDTEDFMQWISCRVLWWHSDHWCWYVWCDRKPDKFDEQGKSAPVEVLQDRVHDEVLHGWLPQSFALHLHSCWESSSRLQQGITRFTRWDDASRQ